MNTSALSTFLVDRIGWLLIHSLWQFTLLAVMMAVVLHLMRHRSAAARYWTALAALATIVIAPAVTWTLLPAYTPQSQAVAGDIPPGGRIDRGSRPAPRIHQHRRATADARGPGDPSR